MGPGLQPSTVHGGVALRLLVRPKWLIHKVLVSLGWREELSDSEREVGDSLKALKTLRCIDGRVSISPSEVLERPGYRDARKQAAALTSSGGGRVASQAMEVLADEDLEGVIARRLVLLRRQGLALDEALDALGRSLKGKGW